MYRRIRIKDRINRDERSGDRPSRVLAPWRSLAAAGAATGAISKGASVRLVDHGRCIGLCVQKPRDWVLTSNFLNFLQGEAWFIPFWVESPSEPLS